jgi:hypothetical protein
MSWYIIVFAIVLPIVCCLSIIITIVLCATGRCCCCRRKPPANNYDNDSINQIPAHVQAIEVPHNPNDTFSNIPVPGIGIPI